MKSIVKSVVSRIARNDAVWRFCNDSLSRLLWLLNYQRRIYLGNEENLIIAQAIDEVIPDLEVRHGPFAGLQYPEKASYGSTLFPKLLGSYEAEIHLALEQVCRNQYDRVIDIGCAEGYYAVGLALRIPSAHVYGFDINEKALAMCGDLAEFNDVSRRITLYKECTPEQLADLVQGKTFIIADCEGCETEIFSDDFVPKLSNCDLLIETHDCLDMSITNTLRKRFSSTHKIEVIKSVDDIQKAHSYKYPEIERFDLDIKKVLLSERPTYQEWFFMTPLTGG